MNRLNYFAVLEKLERRLIKPSWSTMKRLIARAVIAFSMAVIFVWLPAQLLVTFLPVPFPFNLLAGLVVCLAYIGYGLVSTFELIRELAKTAEADAKRLREAADAQKAGGDAVAA